MDLKKVLEQEEIERTGVWLPILLMPGEEMEVLVSPIGNSEANEKFIQLEKEYRRKARLKVKKPLESDVEERLWRQALFGTAVKDWRESATKALKMAGKRHEFNEDNFLSLMDNSLKFRASVLSVVTEEEAFYKENLELIEKN